MQVVQELRALLGQEQVLDAAAVAERSAGIWRQSEPLLGQALVKARNTDDVSQTLRFCHERGLSVVTIGGLTGLVHGADGDASVVLLSTERLTSIEHIDANQRSAIVGAGVTLQALQEAVAESDLMFPLDLGARGTASIGGNVATNAGGNRVFRYGMMRDMVLGVEAVLVSGEVVSNLTPLIKNNAGYDLKQLFIGTEGTLGVITRVCLRLREAPVTRNMALVSCASFSAVKQLLRHMDKGLGGSLSAFETLWQNYYQLVTSPPAQATAPIPQDQPFYVLLETQGVDEQADRDQFTTVLEGAFELELITDAVIAQSEVECERLWSIRDDVQQIFNGGHPYIFDVALPLAEMEDYIAGVQATLADTSVQHCWVFGHLGDGNLHLAVQVPSDQADVMRETVESAVYTPLKAFGGSVSAEHGIGMEKKQWLSMSRSDAELELMRTLKRALDPKGILNAGKVFDV